MYASITATTMIPLTMTVAIPGLLLDRLATTANRAYSVRKLRNAYNGSAMRVRRSSDNGEQDIGFIGTDLDTSSLTSFVGANDGFVVTWYDQSTTADNATQAAAGAQPKIVSTGTLITKNAKPCILFDGVDDKLQSASALTAAEALALFAYTGATFGNFDGAVTGTAVNSPSVGFIGDNGTGSLYDGGEGFLNGRFVNNVATNTLSMSGTLDQVRGVKNVPGNAWGACQIGHDRGDAARFWNGHIGEVIVFDINLSATNRTECYNDEKAF
jgi:hypothetical protein